MKLLVIFAAALLGVQAVRVPYVVTDADGEKYQILLPQQRQGPVYNRPAFESKPNDYEVYLTPLDHEEVKLGRGVSLDSRRPVYDYSAEDYHWPPYRQDVVGAARRREDSAKQSDSASSDEEDESKQERRGNARSGQQYDSDSQERETDDDDEYRLILPHALQGQVHVPGLGVVNAPAVKKVKVKVPHYADAFLRQQIIEQYLASQGLNPEGFDVQGLVARGPQAETTRERGWDLQYSVNQQPKARRFPRPINLQQLMYVTVPERKRRQAVEVSATTNSIDTTTVPDVTETSTNAETTTVIELAEGVTITTDTPLVAMTTSPNAAPTVATPSTSVTTSKPTILPTTESVPIIPLFGYGSILPAEVSHVPFAPRIPRSPTVPTSSTTELPLDAVLPFNKATTSGLKRHVMSTSHIVVNGQSAGAVPFDGKVRTQLTKVTPVPPLPNTDVRGPKMSDLSHMRKARAVNAAPVTATVTEVNALAGEVKTETTAVNCDIQCTKLDLNPVCAFNGECYHEFANQCAMETYICQRPDLGFTTTPRERCVMHWLKRCSSQDLKIE
ncbi:PREDICTED: uncharacterized protein LOC108977758 [Bactrocera latifrons]|uniref:uncharacterized protein LOC108977758 n=1 Tax=Bactrocera latifrons TaxID=174628 RepID=UPI0008DCCA44|nr:PREDICTED: uncharacterized protein LOC108977758 [Bactrocera latifrons]